MPLYHLLDKLWPHLPLPVQPRFALEQIGPLTALKCWQAVAGKELISVYAYVVGDTMVDTGLSSSGAQVEAYAREKGLRKALITHYHEDHSGNAARLQKQGLSVQSAPQTAEILKEDFPIKFYEHLFWGKAPPATVDLLNDTVYIGPHLAQVIPAPGHCNDQVCFFVPSEGWLFSGDAFIHERVKLFRQDEDFSLTLSTLERLCALDFEVLFCAHRPRVTGGKAAMQQKLAWLQEMEGQVRRLHGQGCGVREIVRRLPVQQGSAFMLLTLGDASTANMVRAILEGPRPRPRRRLSRTIT